MREAKLKESQWEYSNIPAKISMKVISKNFIHTREYALKYLKWMELENFSLKMVHATSGISWMGSSTVKVNIVLQIKKKII